MTLIELLREFTDDEIITRLKAVHQDAHEEPHRQALCEIRTLSLLTNSDNLRIFLETTKDISDPEECVDVNGKRDGDAEHYGLEFEAWENWLGMEVDADTLAAYAKLDIVCHALWTMTFMGYSSAKVKAERDSLAESLREIEEEMKNGTMKTYSLEEVKEHLSKIINPEA